MIYINFQKSGRVVHVVVAPYLLKYKFFQWDFYLCNSKASIFNKLTLPSTHHTHTTNVCKLTTRARGFVETSGPHIAQVQLDGKHQTGSDVGAQLVVYWYVMKPVRLSMVSI